MKVAQDEETNPDAQPARPPHPLTYQTRNFPPLVHLSENAKLREYFPGCFPSFVGITYYHVRAYLAPRIAMLCFLMRCLLRIYCFFPLSFSGRLRDRHCCYLVRLRRRRPPPCQSNQASPPPLITRYRLFFSILLALE